MFTLIQRTNVELRRRPSYFLSGNAQTEKIHRRGGGKEGVFRPILNLLLSLFNSFSG
jgi:hypothetical protein